MRSYLHAPELAEDVVQNVFLRVWERHASWSPSEGIRAYLFGACRNQALDHLKHERVVARVSKEVRREGRVPGYGETPARPDQEAQTAELGDALRRAVHELPERRRMVVALRWEHGLSHAEIGKVLGISVKGVETQFGRAMADIRERLARFQ